MIADSKNNGLNNPAAPQALVNGPSPIASQAPPMLIIRTLADPTLLESSLSAKLKSIDPGLIARYATLEEDMSKMTEGPASTAF